MRRHSHAQTPQSSVKSAPSRLEPLTKSSTPRHAGSARSPRATRRPARVASRRRRVHPHRLRRHVYELHTAPQSIGKVCGHLGVGQRLGTREIVGPFLMTPFGQATAATVAISRTSIALILASSEPGLYVIRVKVPSGVPHRHREDRIYMVMSGVLFIGLGDQFDGAKLEPYPPGSGLVLPGNTAHFHRARCGQYVTQVTVIGPTGSRIGQPSRRSARAPWPPRSALVTSTRPGYRRLKPGRHLCGAARSGRIRAVADNQ